MHVIAVPIFCSLQLIIKPPKHIVHSAVNQNSDMVHILQ